MMASSEEFISETRCSLIGSSKPGSPSAIASSAPGGTVILSRPLSGNRCDDNTRILLSKTLCILRDGPAGRRAGMRVEELSLKGTRDLGTLLQQASIGTEEPGDRSNKSWQGF